MLIEFVAETRLERDPDLVPKLPIVQNGPPGTRVVFADGSKVPLPTDQIVFADDTKGSARVGFGGMSFEGIEDGLVVCYRVHELKPEAMLSPGRGRRMTLKPEMVDAIYVDDRKVWPRG
ncbi:MAG: hypothetical protein EOO73_04765 [Myxococcales bacterium]|nr:MAG: hypothetical protein EOO73_04765 [Myxococcales bacterium]